MSSRRRLLVEEAMRSDLSGRPLCARFGRSALSLSGGANRVQTRPEAIEQWRAACSVALSRRPGAASGECRRDATHHPLAFEGECHQRLLVRRLARRRTARLVVEAVRARILGDVERLPRRQPRRRRPVVDGRVDSEVGGRWASARRRSRSCRGLTSTPAPGPPPAGGRRGPHRRCRSARAPPRRPARRAAGSGRTGAW